MWNWIIDLSRKSNLGGSRQGCRTFFLNFKNVNGTQTQLPGAQLGSSDEVSPSLSSFGSYLRSVYPPQNRGFHNVSSPKPHTVYPHKTATINHLYALAHFKQAV
jgi:hypothetical protein